MSASILELQDELIARLTSTTTFQTKSFSIYDLEDLTTHKEAGVNYPMAGVAYEGGEIPDSEVDTHRNAKGRSAANTYRARFSVIIATDYQGSASNRDTKVDALSLLQEVRGAVLGYRGVNDRPWMLLSEGPLDGDMDGVIFYGQLWATDLVTLGTHVETGN